MENNSIFKYQFGESKYQAKFLMPPRTELLTVQMQNGQITIWAKVEREGLPTQERTFIAIGTGFSFDGSRYRYIGTVQEGQFTWHLHEVL